MQLVRGSELNDFLRCRLRWKYAWVDGYKAKKQNDKLAFGTQMHKYLEALYSESDWRVKDEILNFRDVDHSSFDEVEFQEMRNMLIYIVANYVKRYYKQDTSSFEIIATELTFAIPLDDGICYTGTIDLIYKQDGKLYFMDHKTTKSIEKYEKNVVMDRQISRYWWALQQLAKGIGYILVGDAWVSAIGDEGQGTKLKEPAGFVYNIILKDYPQPPKVLKNGSLSKDKSQNTTYELYVQKLRDEGLGYAGKTSAGGYEFPPEYDDILEYLKQYPREYFKRVEVFRNQAEIDASINEFWETVKDMYPFSDMFGNRTIEKPSVYRNITQDCHWDCQFRDVCLAGMDGSDVEHLLSNQFTKEELKNEYHGLRN